MTLTNAQKNKLNLFRKIQKDEGAGVEWDAGGVTPATLNKLKDAGFLTWRRETMKFTKYLVIVKI